MYTIKFGENTLRILSDIGAFSFKKIGKNKAVVYNYTKARKLIDLIREVTYSTVKNHIIFHSDTHLVFKELAKNFTCINAGGGLVINEQNQILFIFRNGKWDLPKGKIEANETTELGAVREVEEECGISGLKIIKELPTVYHTYTLQGKRILKVTYWFEMTTDFDGELKPQTEEDIEKIEWVPREQLPQYFIQTYPTILTVFEAFNAGTPKF